MARGRGGGVTPPEVVRLINEAIAMYGQNATARAIGIPLRSAQKYMAGTAEPSQLSMQKLSDYFGLSVSKLRGELPREEMPSIEKLQNALDHLRAFIKECQEVGFDNLSSIQSDRAKELLDEVSRL